MPKKRVTVSIDEELIAEIENRGLTISNVVEEALRTWLSNGTNTVQNVEAEDKKEVELVRIKASKYPFTCARCGVKYEAGTPGWWNPSTKQMICDACYYSSLSTSKHGGRLYKLLLEEKRLQAEIKKLKEEQREILEEIEAKEKKLAELAKKFEAAAILDQLVLAVMRIAEAVEILQQNPELAKEIRESMRRLEELIPRLVREIKVGTNRGEYDS
jgi:PHD/YefM family antitoxin component YafN of YafNO toxin-antitoxin module